MAIVADGDWVATITFVDRDKNRGSMRFRLPDTLAVAAAFTSALAIADAAALISDAAVEGVSLTQGYYNDALVYSAIAESSDVERKGVFQVATANRVVHTFTVPSISNLKVIDGTNTINTTDAAVLDFWGLLINTGLGVGNSPISNNGDDFVTVYGAPYKRHKASNKG